jgi:hypothetical protein
MCNDIVQLILSHQHLRKQQNDSKFTSTINTSSSFFSIKITAHIVDTFEPNFLTMSISCAWSFRTLTNLSVLILFLLFNTAGTDVMKASAIAKSRIVQLHVRNVEML